MKPLMFSLLVIAGFGCGHLGFGSEEACTGAIARERLPGAGRLHIRAMLKQGEVTQRHEISVEISPAEVRVVGLTPLGTQAYSLIQTPTGSDLTNRIGRHLGLDPGRAFDAVARAFLVPHGRLEGETRLGDAGERLLIDGETGEFVYLDAASQPVARVLREGDTLRVISLACDYEATLLRISESR